MKRILVIEDDRIMRENIAELLELSGYEVDVAENGKEGVEKAQAMIPDMIVCDIKMPVLDGFGVLHILRKNTQTAQIPFLFVTAKTERSDLRKAMEMGADDYLSKPFEDTELIKAVETRLRKSEITKREYTNDAAGFGEFLKDVNLITSIKKQSDTNQFQDFDPKEIVFKTGDYPHYLFFVEKGSVKSYRLNIDGKELISNIYEFGDFFGYQPIFEERVYNETAITMEPTRILKIPKDDFLPIIYSNRDVAGKLIKIMSKNLTKKEKELMHMAYDSVRKRLAIKLKELIPDDRDCSITITRTDLAALIGTTTETLVRTLTELKELEIIETDTHTITLLDREKLNELAIGW